MMFSIPNILSKIVKKGPTLYPTWHLALLTQTETSHRNHTIRWFSFDLEFWGWVLVLSPLSIWNKAFTTLWSLILWSSMAQSSHQGAPVWRPRHLMEPKEREFHCLHSICAASGPKLQDCTVNGIMTLAKSTSYTTHAKLGANAS